MHCNFWLTSISLLCVLCYLVFHQSHIYCEESILKSNGEFLRLILKYNNENQRGKGLYLLACQPKKLGKGKKHI